MFYFWFHTAYIKNNYFCLRKRDLEQACKDTNSKHFSNGFKIELFFRPNDDANTHAPADKADMGNCVRCKKVIVAADSSVILGDRLFHWECVQCDNCGKSFSGAKNCIIKDGKAVCERCEGDDFFTPCNACFRPLTAQRNIAVDDRSWHFDCFRCVYCSKLLNHKDRSEFVISKGDVFCPEHEGMIVGNNKCMSPVCPNPTRDVDMINALGNHFHFSCFKCIECGRKLHYKEDEYTNSEGFPVCLSHEEEEVTCYKCKNGIPIKNALTTFGVEWHPECLKCCESGCNVKWDLNNVEELAEMKQGNLICKEHGLLCCYYCKERIQPLDLIQWEDKDLHKSCFKCDTCNQIINTPNDPNSYYLKNGLPNCIKHQQKCARCAKPINANELLEAKGTTWHTNCFTCQLPTCQQPLSPDQYVVIKGKNYCSSHPQCTRCRNPITDGDQYEDHNGIFHKQCYKCGQCNAPIDPENSAFHGNRLLCKTCHPAPVCARCDKILDGGHLAVGTQHYHESCFSCTECNALFASVKEPISLNSSGLPICKNCIKPKYICYTCGNGIFSQLLEALGHTYHTECFTCENCSVILGGSYALLDDHILCRNCSTTIQRSNCETCNQLLIGKYLLVQGRKHHQDCINCGKCGSKIEISDRQATASNDLIICGSCSGNSQSRPISQKKIEQPRVASGMMNNRTSNMNQQQEQQNRGSGFIKATTPSRPPSAFGAAKPTERTRTMSVSNHRESIAGKQNAPLEPRKSSRSSNNIGFAPSVCGQQGFLSIINNGNAIRRWAVLNGKLLTFYVSQDVSINIKYKYN